VKNDLPGTSQGASSVERRWRYWLREVVQFVVTMTWGYALSRMLWVFRDSGESFVFLVGVMVSMTIIVLWRVDGR
jgi:hypothetical protein